MTKPSVAVAPLTIAEGLWLLTLVEREQKRLIRMRFRHHLADSVRENVDAALRLSMEGLPK